MGVKFFNIDKRFGESWCVLKQFLIRYIYEFITILVKFCKVDRLKNCKAKLIFDFKLHMPRKSLLHNMDILSNICGPLQLQIVFALPLTSPEASKHQQQQPDLPPAQGGTIGLAAVTPVKVTPSHPLTFPDPVSD